MDEDMTSEQAQDALDSLFAALALAASAKRDPMAHSLMYVSDALNTAANAYALVPEHLLRELCSDSDQQDEQVAGAFALSARLAVQAAWLSRRSIHFHTAWLRLANAAECSSDLDEQESLNNGIPVMVQMAERAKWMEWHFWRGGKAIDLPQWATLAKE